MKCVECRHEKDEHYHSKIGHWTPALPEGFQFRSASQSGVRRIVHSMDGEVFTQQAEITSTEDGCGHDRKTCPCPGWKAE